MFRHVRKTNLATFIGVALFSALSPLLYWYALPSEAWNRAVYFATAGLLEADLLRDALSICLVLVFVRAVGGLRPRDLGLASPLPRALLFTALLWALTQTGLALWQLGAAGRISWNGAWLEPGPTFMLGGIVSQLFGNALFEETVWRGFIFVQLVLFAQRRGVWRPLVSALLMSQLFFALIHIPLQLERFGVGWAGLPFWLLATGVAGVIFALTYIQTQNLWIAVGFHAIFNEPTQLFAPPVEPSQIPTTIVTLIGLALVFAPRVGLWWLKPGLSGQT